MSTPFELTGVGTDADGDMLTYCWEQYDLGPHVPISNPSGNTALFRSFNPIENPSRAFPQWPTILNGISSHGETLPSYVRNLRFRFTVRDNHPGSGGVAWDDYQLAVDTAGGPFYVTEPAGLGVEYEIGRWYPIAWEAGKTAESPYDCSTVSVYLSTDGGQTWPIVLASELPNNGSNVVLMPDEPTASGRIRVACDQNVFFNVNDKNFRIVDTGNPSAIGEPGDVLPVRLFPNPATDVVRFSLGASEGLAGEVELRVADATGRVMLADRFLYAGAELSRSFDVARWPAGLYLVEVTDGRGIPAEPQTAGRLTGASGTSR